MSLFIENLKISNFLSFFGEHQVHFKPFSAIMCNFYEGKDDLIRAFEFVFGSKLSDLRVDSPVDLVHKVLKEEFLVNRDIYTYVEVTITELLGKKQLKFCRSVKNGASTPRIEHKISDLVTTAKEYKEKLNSFGVYIRQKNLIIYKKYFNNVIWGSAEDLEETVCIFLRENYLLEDWKKVNKKVEYLKNLKNQTSEKNYYSMKKSHLVVARYTQKYKSLYADRETAAKKILLDFRGDSSDESTSSPLNSAEDAVSEILERNNHVLILEKQINVLTKNLDELKLKEAVLISHLLHEEIKLANKSADISIIQDRINQFKIKIREKENQISEIWKDIQVIKSELDSLNRKIPLALVLLQEMQIKNYRQNRLTQYGRFCDYLRPSGYFHLLKNIIGPNIFYAHLCDSVEDAINLLRQVKPFKNEHREVFIPLGEYSHKLKDILIASDEKGIQINTLEELLIFLCKLKHYQLIDEVPVIVQRDFDFDSVLPKDYTIYLKNNICFTSKGLISNYTIENDYFQETEREIQEKLTQFYIEEEINYRKWNDLFFKKWENLVAMNALEDDLIWVKQKCRKSTETRYCVQKSQSLSEIYEGYHSIFEEHVREKITCEKRSEENPILTKPSAPLNEEYMNSIQHNLANVTAEIKTTEIQLQDLTQELSRLTIITAQNFRLQGNFIKFPLNMNKSRWFLEKEFKMFKKILKENDVENFLGNQEWRKTFIASLIKDFDEIKLKLKTSTDELINISTIRKRKLYQLFDHCSRYLSNTFRHIVNDALPFIKIDFGTGEDNIQITSCLGEEKVNLVDIKHFNTLLKFLSAFSLFLEISNFDKVPFLIIDDIEEYFPIHHDNLEAVLDSNTLKKILPDEHPRFHLMMRLGQFLKHYIKKNTPGKFIRSNSVNAEYANGPVQIIYFTTDDFNHAADHHIWIQNQILPEEYITRNCNSFSAIHEINFQN